MLLFLTFETNLNFSYPLIIKKISLEKISRFSIDQKIKMECLNFEECVICGNRIELNAIEDHVSQCFEKQSQKLFKSPISSNNNNKRQSGNFNIFNCAKKPKLESKLEPIQSKSFHQPTSSSSIVDYKSKNKPKIAIEIPLAESLRPQKLDEYFGQQAVQEKSIMRTLLDGGNSIPSCIFWGPPVKLIYMCSFLFNFNQKLFNSLGCGKTSLAHVIYNQCNQNKERFRFVKMSACTSGVKQVQEAIKEAKTYRDTIKKQTILFMDEIHRFNKLQQDSFLPHIENGTIVLIGATTENPSFSLNNALLSRCRVIVLNKLKPDDIKKILRRGLKTFEAAEIPENVETTSADNYVENLEFVPKITITESCLQWIADTSDGDARIALNSLEMCLKQALCEESDGVKMISLEDIKENIKKTHLLYDRVGDQHYDIISALHKSIRASDDNASIYWLTRMIEAGEDPQFICRRLTRAASEDIGLADPQALILATSTMQAVEKIGMPECDCILAQLAVYLARAPKSTESYFAMLKCKEQIKNQKGSLPSVPLHLRNASNKLMKSLGCGKNYNTLHKDESGLNYLPEELGDINFFE